MRKSFSFIVLFLISVYSFSQGNLLIKMSQKKTRTFTLPELQIGSIFIANLHTVLFAKEGCGVENTVNGKIIFI